MGGDASRTDLLVVNGATAGTTAITVLNRGGLGAQTVGGIKIIDVTGASNGNFTLNGDYVFEGEQAVIAGVYGHRLYKNGVDAPTDGDWYLRSSLLDAASPPGASISSGRADSLKSRWGLSLDRQDRESRLYAVASLSCEWLDGTVANVSGTPIAHETHHLWGEVGLGANVLLGKGLILYAEATGRSAVKDLGNSYGLKGNAGLRLTF